jgi:hypothetical protein
VASPCYKVAVADDEYGVAVALEGVPRDAG